MWGPCVLLALSKRGKAGGLGAYLYSCGSKGCNEISVEWALSQRRSGDRSSRARTWGDLRQARVAAPHGYVASSPASRAPCGHGRSETSANSFAARPVTHQVRQCAAPRAPGSEPDGGNTVSDRIPRTTCAPQWIPPCSPRQRRGCAAICNERQRRFAWQSTLRAQRKTTSVNGITFAYDAQ